MGSTRNGTKLKDGDIILTINKMFAVRIPQSNDWPYEYEFVAPNTKIKLERVDEYEVGDNSKSKISDMIYSYNGNRYHTNLMLNQAVPCKEVAHNPTECKHCEFYLKGCIK